MIGDDRLSMRLDSATRWRLHALVAHTELRASDVVRLALKAMAENQGLWWVPSTERDAPMALPQPSDHPTG